MCVLETTDTAVKCGVVIQVQDQAWAPLHQDIRG